jgi:alpha-glucosidase
MSHTGEKPVDPLILTIFPGAFGSTRIYADAGDTLGYKTTEFTWTRVLQHTTPDGSMQVDVAPVEGSYPGMIQRRSYELRLRGSFPPKQVISNGKFVLHRQDSAAPGWRYDGNTLTTIISLPPMSVHEQLHVKIVAQGATATRAELLNGVPGKILRMKAAMDVLNSTWPVEWSPDELVAAYQTGNRITLAPDSAVAELQKLNDGMPAIVRRIRGMGIQPAVIARALAKLGVQTPAAAAAAQSK